LSNISLISFTTPILKICFDVTKQTKQNSPIRNWCICPSLLIHVFHEACLNRIQVIGHRPLWIPTALWLPFVRRSMADYFSMPTAAIPHLWGYVSQMQLIHYNLSATNIITFYFVALISLFFIVILL
jgi:hypothetical protein